MRGGPGRCEDAILLCYLLSWLGEHGVYDPRSTMANWKAFKEMPLDRSEL